MFKSKHHNMCNGGSEFNKKSSSRQKEMDIRVNTLDAELTFRVSKRTRGHELFNLICRTLGIREVWYFGLRHKDTRGITQWLNLDKRLCDQSLLQSSVFEFDFVIKYFPEDVSDIIQEVTQHLCFLQVKQDILNDNIYCPAEICIVLASYAIQAKYGGDSLPQEIPLEDLLPMSTIQQYCMTASAWMDQISNYRIQHAGLHPEDAKIEYLKVAQDLEMFGVGYFPISNKRKTKLWLGIVASGMNVYERQNRKLPVLSFPWSEIRNISFNDKRLSIRHASDKSKDFSFHSEQEHSAVKIFDLCIGNHELYMQRRRPDTVELQQMKSQALEERAKKVYERSKLEQERSRLEKTEQEKRLLEQTLQHLTEDIQVANETLSRAEEAVGILADKAKSAEEQVSLLTMKSVESEKEVSRLQRLIALSENKQRCMATDAERLTQKLAKDIEQRNVDRLNLKKELALAKEHEQYALKKLVDRENSILQLDYQTSPVGSQCDSPETQTTPVAVRTSDSKEFPPPATSTTESGSIAPPEQKRFTERSRNLDKQLAALRNDIQSLCTESKTATDSYRTKSDCLVPGATILPSTNESRVAFFEDL